VPFVVIGSGCVGPATHRCRRCAARPRPGAT